MTHFFQSYRIVRQKGAITLPISLILLVLLTLVTIYAARVGLLETRTSANKQRAQQALSAAELGIEQAVAFVQANKANVSLTSGSGWARGGTGANTWTQCSATASTPPCSLIDKGVANSTTRTRWMYLANMTNLSGITTNCTDKVNSTNSDWPDGTCDGTTSNSQVAGKYNYVYLMTQCRDTNNDGDCADAGESTSQPFGFPAIKIVAEGQSADGLGTSIVENAAYFYDLGSNLSHMPAPFMAAGSVSGSGNFNVVTNPDADGTVGSRPLSFWTKLNVTVGSAAQTCYLGEENVSGFLKSAGGSGMDTQTTTIVDSSGVSKTYTVRMCRGCVCPTSEVDGAISIPNSTHETDILDVDTNSGKWLDTTFPADVFQYVFGVPESRYQVIKDLAASYGHLLADCSTLDTNSGNPDALYWITGDCSLPGDVGSLAYPLILVVEGRTRINSNNYFWGLAFPFSSTHATLEVDLNGTPTLYGAMVSNTSISLSNGTYKARYVPEIFKKFEEKEPLSVFAKLPGSWRDY